LKYGASKVRFPHATQFTPKFIHRFGKRSKKMFASPRLGRKISKDIGLKGREAPMCPPADAASYVGRLPKCVYNALLCRLFFHPLFFVTVFNLQVFIRERKVF